MKDTFEENPTINHQTLRGLPLWWVREAFGYDPATGRLYHNPQRPQGHFKRGTADMTPEDVYRSWQRRFAGKRIMRTDSNGYGEVHTRYHGTDYYILIHRLIWFLVTGKAPAKTTWIIHKDGDIRNNRLSNLEAVTKAARDEMSKERLQAYREKTNASKRALSKAKLDVLIATAWPDEYHGLTPETAREAKLPDPRILQCMYILDKDGQIRRNPDRPAWTFASPRGYLAWHARGDDRVLQGTDYKGRQRTVMNWFNKPTNVYIDTIKEALR